VPLFGSQILRTILDIRGRNIDWNDIERKIRYREFLRRAPANSVNSQKIHELTKDILENCFIPEYISVKMDSTAHYEKLYQHGFIVNGHTYKRLSCSAGQARVSTVIFCDIEIIDEVKLRLNNGRDLTQKIAPSKYNAYFGLYGSATRLVSEPRFIVVPDYSNIVKFRANYVTETDWDDDDIVDEREVELEMNRTDGMGLISPEFSARWADDIGVDYVPSQWCVRQSFIKGMLCTFDFRAFCREVNGGNYIVDTIYKDDNGNPIKADLRDVDIILSESQFKLWDSYQSLEEYIENCHTNKLYWGVTQFSPKRPKSKLNMNYQFIQTLDLNEDEVKGLCSDFESWVQSVTIADHNALKLYLLGTGMDESSARKYIDSSDRYWTLAAIRDSSVTHDPFIKQRIRDMLVERINGACMGEIFVDGNFQTLVSDPYAFMQHVCGLEPTGLLREGEFYSHYWNEKGVTQVDAMRSPLTFRSEHVILNLRNDDEVNKWYRYCETGIILNWYGHEVVNFAGADFDFDILATTSNPYVIKGVYRDELPVVYDPPKPEKKVVTEDDMYHADIFSFGSIIGSITNKSSNAYALLPEIERRFGRDSEEYKLTYSRLKQCCKAQSAQIDKAKIGREVKGIPKKWIRRTDDVVSNNVLLCQYPYFFKYRYRKARKDCRKYVERSASTFAMKFGMSLPQALNNRGQNSPEVEEFIENYYRYMPVTYSDSTMNLLCRHIEDVSFGIKQRLQTVETPDYVSLYKRSGHDIPENIQKQLIDCFAEHKKLCRLLITMRRDGEIELDDDKYDAIRLSCDGLMDDLLLICSDEYAITNTLVDYFYRDHPTLDKTLLWEVCGKTIYSNICINSREPFMIPVLDDDGTIRYLGDRYRSVEI
jgi:hypothetical protein